VVFLFLIECGLETLLLEAEQGTRARCSQHRRTHEATALFDSLNRPVQVQLDGYLVRGSGPSWNGIPDRFLEAANSRLSKNGHFFF
jgi:hypothetical protein